MYAKYLYPLLFSKQEPDPVRFLYKIARNKEHNFWGAARDFSREILSKDLAWSWLAFRIDDFGGLVEKKMRKKIPKWVFKAQLGVGALAKHLHSTESTAKWLLDRYVNELKNLFDKRYKDALDIQKVYVVGLEEFHAVAAATAWDIDSVEESGELYHIGGEV